MQPLECERPSCYGARGERLPAVSLDQPPTDGGDSCQPRWLGYTGPAFAQARARRTRGKPTHLLRRPREADTVAVIAGGPASFLHGLELARTEVIKRGDTDHAEGAPGDAKATGMMPPETRQQRSEIEYIACNARPDPRRRVALGEDSGAGTQFAQAEPANEDIVPPEAQHTTDPGRCRKLHQSEADTEPAQTACELVRETVLSTKRVGHRALPSAQSPLPHHATGRANYRLGRCSPGVASCEGTGRGNSFFWARRAGFSNAVHRSMRCVKNGSRVQVDPGRMRARICLGRA